MIDSYKLFMERFKITQDQLLEFGLDESININLESTKEEWNLLKKRIYKGKEKVYIRGYGRDAKGTELYLELYKELFGHGNFYKDPTNNAEPTKLIRNLTGYSRQENSTKFERLRNYQVSHIFGKTKNPFSFTAPWNIVYVPKIMDPLTGHESKGDLTDQFKEKFHMYYYNFYKEFILDFNSIMEELRPKVKVYLDSKQEYYPRFVADAYEQFAFIDPKEINRMLS